MIKSFNNFKKIVKTKDNFKILKKQKIYSKLFSVLLSIFFILLQILYPFMILKLQFDYKYFSPKEFTILFLLTLFIILYILFVEQIRYFIGYAKNIFNKENNLYYKTIRKAYNTKTSYKSRY
jgi:Cu/Ag efflux pump CusA